MGCPQELLSTPALSPIGAVGASSKARGSWPFPNICTSIIPFSGEVTSWGKWLRPAKLMAHGALQDHSPCCPLTLHSPTTWLRGHRRVCWHMRWFLSAQHGPCQVPSLPPACPQPSTALPGSCTGQGLSPGCLFPQLRGHRASWQHGSTPLTPRKVRGFPGSGKKQELAAGDSSWAHPEVELFCSKARGIRAPKLPSLSPFPDTACLRVTSSLGRAVPGEARLFSRNIASAQGQTDQTQLKTCPHTSHQCRHRTAPVLPAHPSSTSASSPS